METKPSEGQRPIPFMLHMPAARSYGVVIAALSAVLLLLFGIVGLWISFNHLHHITQIFVALLALVALGLGGVACYLFAGFFSIRYSIVGRELWIRWAHRQHRLPLERITYAGPAAPILGVARNRRLRFWPGYYVDRLDTALGVVQVVATQPLSRQLLVSTDTVHFAISPARSAEFLEQLTMAQRATQQAYSSSTPRPLVTSTAPPVEQVPRRSRAITLTRAFWRGTSRFSSPLDLFRHDPVMRTFALLAVLLDVGLVLLLVVEYNQLPQTLVLHWNASGLPDRIGDRQEVWILPVMTTLVTVANGVLSWVLLQVDRMAARFLLGLTSLVHLVAWVALFSVIRG